MSEIPVHPRPRRLADWINPMGAKKVHSLVDKIYKRKNLEIAGERVQANRGSGGVDGQSLEGLAAEFDQQLGRLQRELQEDTYQPQPVRQVQIPKAGKPGEFRTDQSFSTAWRTLHGIEAVHMIRKGRARWAGKGDPLAQRLFIDELFGLAI